jgi:hypothetical protein
MIVVGWREKLFGKKPSTTPQVLGKQQSHLGDGISKDDNHPDRRSLGVGPDDVCRATKII